MRIHTLQRRQVLDGTPAEVFPFFADATNLEAITPPLLRFRVITPAPIEMAVGTLIEYRLRIHGLPIRWQTLIQRWDADARTPSFVDTQLRGPYALWHHTHTFEPVGDDRTEMTDTVRYAIGFGPLGDLAHTLFVRRDVEAIFEHRARVTPALVAADIARRAAVPASA
ncbi:SRPBCC family protein [Paraconexibacter algicola]|uniref:CDP-paratose 2-epimerase n=2 Tax=Solirubrobacterales TaxID=588673 RepID=A0A2T4UCF2_9ACTN|nr:SRPBCC family protein [Paraconexibacter algicola]PTL54915.1 CDP-paratose 2-epimerase [Paraconexibacter algicola]